MKVELPAKYAHIFEDVPHIFRSVEIRGDKAIVELALGFSVKRTALNMQPKEFRDFYDSIKVSEGRKTLKFSEVTLEPTKTAGLYFRIPATALALIKEAAKLSNESLSEYCLKTILARTVEELKSYAESQASKGATHGG
ncbi:MAG: hypothetical protein H5T49_03285 [Hadesarchaea archaeon]|nr:hypothetical protein [Hadesarchaea archaeon]